MRGVKGKLVYPYAFFFDMRGICSFLVAEMHFRFFDMERLNFAGNILVRLATGGGKSGNYCNVE